MPTDKATGVSASPGPREAAWFPLALGGLLVLTGVVLALLGRRGWCACGEWSLWKGDVWTSHCSQHVADPYSITHVSHGLLLYFPARWLLRRVPEQWRLIVIAAIAAAWEIAENTPWVIDRYRSATMSLDYLGDSVANSLSDMLCCVAGCFIARLIGLWRTLALFAATEVFLLWYMRDNLTLNVIMLLFPLEAIKQWQTAGH
ncbi:MAG: DUF2585 family protein [Phycisphaerales bacterium]